MKIPLVLAAFLAGIFFGYDEGGDLQSAGFLADCLKMRGSEEIIRCARPHMEPMIQAHGLGESLKLLERASVKIAPENKASARESGAVLKGMLCYLKELARLGHLGALDCRIAPSSSPQSGEVFGAGGNKISCHDLAHALGEVGTELLGPQAAVTQCRSSCGYGCYHGAIAMALRKDFEFLKKLPVLCEKSEGHELIACRHGTGHGLADIANRNVQRAVELCDAFEAGIAREECATGVFMEIIDTPSGEYSQFEFPSDILSFCATLPGVYADVCKRNSAAYEFKRHHDPVRAFDLCRKLDAGLDRDCAISLGLDFYFIFGGDNEKITEVCRGGDERQAGLCVEGAKQASDVK